VTAQTTAGDTTAAAFRAALDSVFASPAYRWAEMPAPERFLREWWQRLGNWLGGVRADNPAAFRLLLLALVVVLLAVIAHGAWVVWRTVRGAAAPGGGGAPLAAREPRDAAWYRRAADRAAAAGRIAEALQLAFVGLALALESDGLLRYDPSKTPAECAREARLAPEDRARLRALVHTLYACAFCGGACGGDDYRRWREATAAPWHAAAG
jgi:hypothetical protein